MAERRGEYSVADIKILSFDDSVRARPGMYFGVGPSSPDLPTRVLEAVLSHALHPAAVVAPMHAPVVHAQITADLAFTVVDDHAAILGERGLSRPGYLDGLLGPDRWLSAAAAVLSSRAVVEVWRDGRGFRQELVRLQPSGSPEEFDPPQGRGTRVAFELEEEYLGRDAAIGSDLGALDLHGPACSEYAGPGFVALRDLRSGSRPVEFRY